MVQVPVVLGILCGRTMAFCSSRAFSALDCTAIASAMCSDDRGDDFRFPSLPS